MTIRKLLGFAVLAVLGYTMVTIAQTNNLMQKLAESGVSKFVEAMKSQEDFKDRLQKQPGQYIVFAPNDAAFSKWGKWDSYAGNRKMRRLLKYAVILRELTVEQATQVERFVTGDGTEVSIKKEGSGYVIINDSGKIKAKIIKHDIKFSNGYINVIDTVLTPKDIE